MVGEVVDEPVARVEFVGLTAGVSAVELLVAFPAALRERNRFTSDAVEGRGASFLERHRVGERTVEVLVAKS